MEIADKRIIKSESLDQLMSQIRSAFHNSFLGDAEDEDIWIREIFDDKVIVETDEGLLSYPYMIDGNNKIEFGEPAKVEVNYKPVKMTVKPVKAGDGEWLLDVLGAPFGGPVNGRDRDGEYFNETTNFMLDQLPSRPIVHYHGFDSEGNPVEPEIIGREVSHEVRSDGVWFRVALDQAKDTARRIWEAAQNGLARASSGAINHFVRVEDDGHIRTWPLAELSLMDMGAGEYPANAYAVAMPVSKALFKAANLTWPFEDKAEEKSQGAESPDAGAEPPPAKTEAINNPPTRSKTMSEEKKTLTLEDIGAFLDKRDAVKAEEARIKALEAQAEELKQLKADIEKAKAEREEEGRKQVKRLPQPEPPSESGAAPVVYSKWDGFTIGQLGLAWDMLKASGSNRPMELYRAMHSKVAKAAKAGKLIQGVTRNKRGEIMREFNPAMTAKAIIAAMAVNPMQMADKGFKADELHGSDVVDAGDEWVPPLWSSELWDLVRNEARVLSRFRQIEVMGESLTIPTLEGKTTLYKTAQTDDQSELTLAAAPATMSKLTTGNTTLTPVKNMAWLGWTGELDEDSIVPILPSLQEALRLDISEQIDEMLISGDTDTTTTNISDTGNGAIAATWHLLSVNGLRDFAFANTNTSDRGALTAEDFLAIMGLMGTNGVFALDPERLFWICDAGVYRKALALSEVLTADKRGQPGTVVNGRLTGMFGSDLIVSDKYGLTDANGKIHNTPGNNTLGSFLLVRPDRWVVGFGRRIVIESPARGITEIVTDTRHLVASFRIDFKSHSTDDASALGYNVTV